MNTNDTPRTDAIESRHCPPQPEQIQKKHEDAYDLCRQLERELAHSLANQLKAQAEVDRLRGLCERVINALTHTADPMDDEPERLRAELLGMSE
jgi:hypothetical protein